MGVMAPHVVSDRCSDPLRVRQNVVVPKAQDAEALAPPPFATGTITPTQPSPIKGEGFK